MKKILSVTAIMLLFVAFQATAQDHKMVNGAYTSADVMPSFPGGETELFNQLSKAVVYPKEAKESRLKGTVLIDFVVKEDGSVDNITVLRSVSSDLDGAAIAALKSLPKWNPGTINGKAVPVKYVLPFRFELD